MAKKKCLLGFNSSEGDKNILDGGVGALPKIIKGFYG
jgi:hypothetical protein